MRQHFHAARRGSQSELQQVFEAVLKLPRRQQQKVIEMADRFLALHKNGKAA